ncbi:MAG: hypothetical protein WC465_00185 [Patescibacteria group bacterium]
MNQIELHNKILKILAGNIGETDADEIKSIISTNDDARRYFFSKADEKWLVWLWQNGFMDAIKEKIKDSSSYAYASSELNYLVKVAEKVPDETAKIILEVPVEEGFNSEVVDRFLWICSTMPAPQLSRIVPKILNENWVILMSRFRDWGFEYDKMFQILEGAKDYESILLLAEAVLSVKSQEEYQRDGVSRESPFYIEKLFYTKVFEHLVKLPVSHIERALSLINKTILKISLINSEDSSSTFSIIDTFSYGIDFFSLNLGENKHDRFGGDVQNLIAALKLFLERFVKDCINKSEIERIYNEYIFTLPSCEAMWRFRLFALNLSSEIFQNSIKEELFSLFNGNPYDKLIIEYQKLLGLNFSNMAEVDKRSYVAQVFEFFGAKVADKKELKWNKQRGLELLSNICRYLTDEELSKCEDVFEKQCILDYKPEPLFRKFFAGTVTPIGPISAEEFTKFSIKEIAENLRNNWSPKNLYNKYKNDDFLKPRNAEGVGEILKSDISKRLQDYVSNADLFFDPQSLAPHYSYSFFRGIETAIKDNIDTAKKVDWSILISFLIRIRGLGQENLSNDEKEEREEFDSWLAGWDSVHSAIVDVIQILIGEGEEKHIINFPKYREKLIQIISYLLEYKDPVPSDENIETAKMKTSGRGSKDYFVSDPYSMAINTVRGRAFQALVLFVYRDGKEISKDIKKEYETVLKDENTRALMFMFGRFLPSFYLRDKQWIKGLLEFIFPIDPSKNNLYLAAWEGYLTGPLYEQIFGDEDFQKLYYRGLSANSGQDTHRKYVKAPEEGIADHLALAFMHYEKFGFRNNLFREFWKRQNTRRDEFIRYLGSLYISGSNDNADKLLIKNPLAKKRLEKIWDYVLQNFEDPKLFENFGFWMNIEKNVFDEKWLAKNIAKTLEKSKGSITWDYGLTKSITRLAEIAPEDSLLITRYFFFEGMKEEKRRPFYLDDEWIQTFKILYKNPITKQGTYKLIDDLIREGGSVFWKLEDLFNL